MRLLLDTHSFLWFVGGDTKLTDAARSAIEDSANQSFLSVVSLWEMAIKISLGRLSLGEPFASLIPRQLQQNGFELLGITVPHAASVISLPFRDWKAQRTRPAVVSFDRQGFSGKGFLPNLRQL